MKCAICEKEIKNKEKCYQLLECWIGKDGWIDPDQSVEMAAVCSGKCLAECAALIATDT